MSGNAGFRFPVTLQLKKIRIESPGQDFICLFSHNLFMTMIDNFTGKAKFKEVKNDDKW